MTRWYRSTGDLLVVALWSIIAATAVLELGVQRPVLRVLLVTPLVLFFPGYALLEATFPERPVSADRCTDLESMETSTREKFRLDSIDGLERFVLASVVSLGLVPLVAFVVNYTPYGLRLQPIMVAVTGVTVVFVVVGFVRRLRLPAERRRRSTFVGGIATLWSRYVAGDGSTGASGGSLRPRTNTHRALNLLLVFGLLTLVGTVGYAALAPPDDGAGFTEAYLVTQTDTGEYTSEDLPQEFTAGEGQRLFVALGNQEHEQITYTIVATLDGNELSRTEETVASGETAYVEREITPQQTGDSLPLRFFVYKGDAPETASAETAYRTVDLWISVG
ncbi:Uncharacterized membrane protein [Halogranum amylolyticum]|uniref:Uncharacterized membrane protein n=1 Tax=Halogranum amylolyticum TaxID=660520 RepID=A0A1H8WM16_9EURY|nr:DUF1616 domain-containing protein [Halogranum amylolyticum]SEP28128.1 Uncharacterized membrane protein [Halogranum amylolyticum]